MPYGLPKDIGGDNPENVRKMESCVKQVMSEGKSKKSAIRICKASLIQHKRRMR